MLACMKKPVLILQQLSIEPAALLAEIVHDEGWETVPVLAKNEPVPVALDGYAGLIVMGGPMSANDVHLDFIAAELKLLKKAIAQDFPVLGICLGSQLLAKAAGATIHAAAEHELGWYPLTPLASAADDPLFSDSADGLDVFQWHGETFSLPEEATLLASCESVPHQAFRLGSCQYGLQFHIEVDEAIIRTWIDANDADREHLGDEGVKRMLAETPARIDHAHTFCREMTKAWLGLLDTQ